MDEVRRNLQKAIKARNLTYKEVSLEIGKSHSYVQQFIERGVPGSLKERDRGKLSEILDIPEEKLGAPSTWKSKNTSPNGILSLDIHAALGAGGAISATRDENGEIDQVNGLWEMPDHVLAMFPNPKTTYAIAMVGDSMLPTIASGSVAFVDVSQKNPKDSDVFACNAGDGLIIKRLELVPRTEKILVSSDNEKYKNYELNREDVEVYGRMVACFDWRG